MIDIRDQWFQKVSNALRALFQTQLGSSESFTIDLLVVETPPDQKMGDMGFPMFAFARSLKMAPPAIATQVVALLEAEDLSHLGTAKNIGPYVNVFLSKTAVSGSVLARIIKEGKEYGKTGSLAGKRLMIEFSSPNTNKPLHLGHLRNDALGESIARMYTFCGADVFKVNIVNNRGIHICKSMLSYQKFFAPKTPESEGIKSDRFVGDCYVAYNNYAKEYPEQAESEAQTMLQAWEKGDPAIYELWEQMNAWAEKGIQQTYKRTGISFDKIYYESDTYLKGKDEILQGLEKRIFYREEDGSVWVDLEPIGLDKKVLLRKDGTALYMTQDIGTAIFRHHDWDFNELVYVVGSEQQYHFKVLFYVLKKLGYSWAENLFHLSYGMVNLPEGKMKSREGTVVDGDDLINSLRDGALEEIQAKGREEEVGDPLAVAEKIALAALHYFLLQVTPTKDMIFNPKESLSFQGNTGPYLQYMGARIASILRKAKDIPELATGSIVPNLLTHETEWELLKILEAFPETVNRAAKNFDPSILTSFLYDLSKAFSRFYHDCQILSLEDINLKVTRLELVKATKIVLESALDLVLVPFLESM